MMGIAALAVAAGGMGCHVKTVTTLPPSQVKPLLDSSRGALLAKYEELSKSVRTLNAKVELAPHTGSRYSGVIEDYKQVNGFILAVSPNHIRVIGQAPVVNSKVFDMVSDGETFRIFIPPKKKFIVGPANFAHASKKPLENLRPQHILDAILWPPLEKAEVLFTEEDEGAAGRFYALTVERLGNPPEATRRIWFDRTDLSLARVDTFDTGGRLLSVTRYSNWQAADGVSYPREISMDRPNDGYRLEIHIVSLTLNAEISLDRFKLDQPPGTDLVRIDEKGEETTTPGQSGGGEAKPGAGAPVQR
jgi:hypothetical protein